MDNSYLVSRLPKSPLDNSYDSSIVWMDNFTGQLHCLCQFRYDYQSSLTILYSDYYKRDYVPVCCFDDYMLINGKWSDYPINGSYDCTLTHLFPDSVSIIYTDIPIYNKDGSTYAYTVPDETLFHSDGYSVIASTFGVNNIVSPLLSELQGLLPILLPLLIALIAFRKGIGFTLSRIRGA